MRSLCRNESRVSLELLYDVDVEGRVRFLAEGLEVGEHGVLRARPEGPLEQALEAGQSMRVVGQTEVTIGIKKSIILILK